MEARRDQVADNEQVNHVVQSLMDHAPIIISLAASVAFAVKILRVSAMDANTAFAIVQSVGPFQVLTGVLISLVPISLILLICFYFNLSQKAEAGAALKSSVVGVGIGLTTIWMMIVPWLTFVLACVVGLIVLVVMGWRRHRRGAPSVGSTEPKPETLPGDPPADLYLYPLWKQLFELERQAIDQAATEDQKAVIALRVEALMPDYRQRELAIAESRKRQPGALLISVLVGTLAIQALVLFTDKIWLPSEAIYARGRPTPYVGYVLKDDGEWMTILLDDSRAVVRLRAAQVNARYICELEGVGSQRSIFELLPGDDHDPEYPECPNQIVLGAIAF